MNTTSLETLRKASHALRNAEAVIVTAGAGMGVDSGLPDFRGSEGFWKAYPPFRQLGLKFADVATPAWFERDPDLAWGFYGHRLNLYRRTRPHLGFSLLLSYLENRPKNGFVFTSNVDGQFQRAGFSESRIVECHGSIHRLQRVGDSQSPVWNASGEEVLVDERTMRAIGKLPTERGSGILARPNIKMFSDRDWNASVTEAQHDRYREWLEEIAQARVVVIEIGAGVAVPAVRRQSEMLVSRYKAQLVRINPRDSEVPPGQFGLPCGALEGLQDLLA